MMLENNALSREDIAWWESRGGHLIEDLHRRHEGLPLIPETGAGQAETFQMLAEVRPDEQFQTSLPVYDLAVKAGTWGSEVVPDVQGWARVLRRPLDPSLFVARVVGHSMEPGISDGAWGVFRSFSADWQPSPTTLDGRRVLARLASKADPETGAYTLKRWRVSKLGAGGEVLEVTLRPDNKALKPIIIKPGDGDVRVVAQFLETIG